MNIAIVGSRDFQHTEYVVEYVRQLHLGDMVISGGARGIDSLAVFEAEQCGLEKRIIDAKWEMGKWAGMERNEIVVREADKVVIFWDGVSKGSRNVIELCQVAGKQYEVIFDE